MCKEGENRNQMSQITYKPLQKSQFIQKAKLLSSLPRRILDAKKLHNLKTTEDFQKANLRRWITKAKLAIKRNKIRTKDIKELT